jgi:hypothetical protein
MNFISLLGRRPADRIVGVTPMNNVGTWLGPSVAARRAPDARRTPPLSPALPITFTGMRASRTNALRSPLSAPHSWQITSEPRPLCRREAVDLPSGRDIPGGIATNALARCQES